MNERDFLAVRFEEHRPRLRAVAYQMLGSLSDADDAVQEAWLRLARADDTIDNLGGWLTTVVGRVSLDMLRTRRLRRESPLEPHLPDPVVSREEGADPEREALLSDSVGLALLVVLESLSPAERLAFVLHDMFGLPFDEIAPIMERTPVATRKLASRARRHVQGAVPKPDPDPAIQRRLVDAFMTAARSGSFDDLLAILHPDVVLRGDSADGMTVLRGARVVAGQVAVFHRMATVSTARPAVVNGTAGLVNTIDGDLISIMSFTVADGKIIEIDILSDPGRLARIDLTGLEP
ncbi:sigma-70 family RNA polymerase sigma factor [Actinomadura rudentiformis]|uniref:Sigma-70 family RNA polymerase sigma factor n=1 Tax=Actinomadura rudentiformis TaxID=359158 RepID=A0A6H9Z6A8_9ACTN|nr:sigma-70 family RNA polymerase sigma factor [Actinomadura rudentiformis]KAB2350310.1 sigma-70 family RNA polymerase sigma factor [Actinomadura rudentiformis]